MPTRLSRLRIAGFKSFAEPVSVDILPGLTGIVGPNGCGKSNVVEALRWAMGETSARSLRGGEMDDVIFAGTTARASRNLAEVTITMEGDLPAPFEAEAELQVTRRIERGAGSSYRAGGRELRARDVQTLYADLASGARSSGMVSQGRVAQLVNARPEERRGVLEEAAGITGLHARRHEAELKLRAAEANLARSDDLRMQLESGAEGLRKQARQAARYRNLSGLIRNAEAEHLAVRLAIARSELEAAGHAHAQAAQAAETAQTLAGTQAHMAEAAEAILPQLRTRASAAERGLERCQMAAESAREAAARMREEAEATRHRLLELTADHEAALRQLRDAQASLTQLGDERARLERDLASHPERAREAEQACRRCADAASIASAAAEQAGQALRAAHIEDDAARGAEQAARARRDEAMARRQAAEAELAQARALLVPEESLAEAAERLASAEAALSEARRTASDAAHASTEAARALSARQAEAERAAETRRIALHAGQDAEARLARLACARDEAGAALEDLRMSRPLACALTDSARALEQAIDGLKAAEDRLVLSESEARLAREAQEERERAARDARAATHQAEQAVSQARSRAARLHADRDTAERALTETESARPDAHSCTQAADEHAAAETRRAALLDEVLACQSRRVDALSVLEASRLALNACLAESARVAGEVAGLADLAAEVPSGGLDWSAIDVPAGLEPAFGAALGDGCELSLGSEAPRFWRALPDAPPPRPPAGTIPLAQLVAPPAPLARLFAATFLLPDEADGDLLQPALGPGAILVRRDGASWSWDGRVARPGAPNPAARHLLRARRLAEARAAQRVADEQASQAQSEADRANAAEANAALAERDTRALLADAEADVRQARDRHDALTRQAAQAEAAIAGILPALLGLREECAQADAALAAATLAFTGTPDAAEADAAARQAAARHAAAATQADEARAALQQARSDLSACQEAHARLQQCDSEAAARIDIASAALRELEAECAAAARARAALAETLATLPDPARIEAALVQAAEAEQSARRAEDASRSACEAAAGLLDAAQSHQASLRAHSLSAVARESAARTHAERARQDETICRDAWDAACRRVAGLPDLASLAGADANARAQATQARDALQQATTCVQGAVQAGEQARARAALLDEERTAWTARHAEASARARSLADRTAAAREMWQSLEQAPAALAAREEASALALADAEADHASIHARLAEAERDARSHILSLRDAEQRAGVCREAALRAEASRAAAESALRGVMARVAERLGEDANLPEAADASPEAEERARRRLERLSRERDEMGPVNLRADLELGELDERLAALAREREELGAAIAKLRGAIGHLNREGRERLTAVFTQVDQHFRTLFTRMMGGGRAHLALTGSDDPLSAGLEIYAEPPGKKLASLALLSGGEQALTALSLIFAVFRCTPAPVSVLDEVDAPLDDANVDRFCTLLEDVVRETGTRFLVVTHHQLTMSRMDRLYGVTMQERGVSRLLSVDLRQAEAYAATAPMPVPVAAE